MLRCGQDVDIGGARTLLVMFSADDCLFFSFSLSHTHPICPLPLHRTRFVRSEVGAALCVCVVYGWGVLLSLHILTWFPVAPSALFPFTFFVWQSWVNSSSSFSFLMSRSVDALLPLGVLETLLLACRGGFFLFLPMLLTGHACTAFPLLHLILLPTSYARRCLCPGDEPD